MNGAFAFLKMGLPVGTSLLRALQSSLNFTKMSHCGQDDFMRRTFILYLLGLTVAAGYARGETDQEALARATTAVAAASTRAQADPAHPVFHVASPAQWMNDPNGPIFYRGYYHLFYQLHPYSDQDGTKYWGHVRSRDLVKWERLPIALAPSNDRGEEAIWSGCCTINGRGQPMIFYTSIAQGKSPFDHAEQWAATSDDALLHWQKSPANPVLSEALNRGRKIYDWRDPFVFHEGKRTFLVTGGHLAKAGEAAVSIYEAENPELTQWTYRGVLFQVPNAPTAECPNFFKLGNQWVLFVSPYGKVQYFVGDFDPQTCRFTPRTQGLLDYGPSFYAPNTMLLSGGGRLVWGWVNGFPPGHGWNGCLSLPRQLSLSHEGGLLQTPAPQLARLRGKAIAWRNTRCDNAERRFELPPTNTLEIRAEIDLKKVKGIELQLQNGPGDPNPVTVRFDRAELSVMDAKAPWPAGENPGNLTLRIFVDRSVLEVVANNAVWITKTIAPLEARPRLSLRADGGAANFKLLQAWPMKTIW